MSNREGLHKMLFQFKFSSRTNHYDYAHGDLKYVLVTEQNQHGGWSWRIFQNVEDPGNYHFVKLDESELGHFVDCEPTAYFNGEEALIAHLREQEETIARLAPYEPDPRD